MSETPALITAVEEMRVACQRARRSGIAIGLVPTMGALHEGHLTLVREAKRIADQVVVSIFVNPKQFGPGEDLDQYPRELGADLSKLARLGVDWVFAPGAQAMYPAGFATGVHVRELTAGMCGASRPSHFDGVATVVTKLFSIIGPCTAIFGRKDYQQLQVIRCLTRDLNLPIRIVGVPTVRESDGLALSSRNRYLTRSQRERALALSRGLAAAQQLFGSGERRAEVLHHAAAQLIAPAVDQVAYLTIADPDTLSPVSGEALVGERVLLAVAARVGTTRLIDNAVLGEDPAVLSGEPHLAENG